MPRKFDPDRRDALVSRQRQLDLDTHLVMSLIPLAPYHVVADVGCGPGYFTVPLAKHLFYGKVIALDTQQEMLDATREQLERVRLGNVELSLSQEATLPLDDDSLDGAFIALVLHEADSPKAMLEEVKRCVRRGGWLALIEWHGREMDAGPPLEDRIDEAKLREMAEDVGFRFSTRRTLNSEHYMLLMWA